MGKNQSLACAVGLLLSASPVLAEETLDAAPPAKRATTPYPVAAIIEELRKTSGDDRFARALTEPPAPPDAGPVPVPVAQPVPVPVADTVADAGPPPVAVAVAPVETHHPPAAAPVAPPEPAIPDDMAQLLAIKDESAPHWFNDSDDMDPQSGGSTRQKAKPQAAASAEPALSPLEELNRAKQRQADAYQSGVHHERDSYAASIEAERARYAAGLKAQKERWLKDRARYLKSVPVYRSDLIPRSGGATMSSPRLPQAPHTLVPKDVASDAFVLVNGGMEVPIRDQKNRGTCAAFAGVRALETVAKGSGKDVQLSEQFFYWLSKPDCQSVPCSGSGSSPKPGYSANLGAAGFVIPTEQSCPYNPNPVPSNDTQTPLPEACQSAPVLRLSKVTSAWSFPDILRALDSGQPVTVASTLSENFFTSTGVVTAADAAKQATRDSEHAGGHFYLAVGYMALPQSMQAAEGRSCLLIANSWGEGWGAGGYSCVTENWFSARRFQEDFISPSEVVVP